MVVHLLIVMLSRTLLIGSGGIIIVDLHGVCSGELLVGVRARLGVPFDLQLWVVLNHSRCHLIICVHRMCSRQLLICVRVAITLQRFVYARTVLDCHSSHVLIRVRSV